MTRHDEFGDSLGPVDQRLVDLLVDSGFERRAVRALPASQQDQAERILRLFELLDDYPVEDGDDTLVHATLARIDRHEDQLSARMAFGSAADSQEQGRRRRIRLPDFISIAAVILIGFSVVWPVSSHLRQRSIDLGCANNLRLLGVGFGNYASDYDSAMPVAMANLGPEMSWDKIRNVVNLNPLVNGGYCELAHLSCPGHADLDGESYSYQWMMHGERPTWGVHRVTIVLGDRNPVIDAALSGRNIPPLSMSINHSGRGQNTLGSDGATLWLMDPVVGSNNDYIWLPRGVSFLRIGDRPTDPVDVFLAH